MKRPKSSCYFEFEGVTQWGNFRDSGAPSFMQQPHPFPRWAAALSTSGGRARGVFM